MNKREATLGLLTSLGGLSLLASASASAATLGNDDAMAAIMTWFDALQTGDPATVIKVLAPEFQILRSDGSGYDKESYPAALPKLASAPEVKTMVATFEGDTAVIRYMLEITETIDGQPVQAVAPRLSVMRKTPTGWLMIAHANFARIG
jgi:ketosteroid isomerase-like protein